MDTLTHPDTEVVDDIDDLEAHSLRCQCDECEPDRRHDDLAAA